MIVRKLLIFIGIVLGCTPQIFGDNNVPNIKNKSFVTSKNMYAKISGDIERPLLRPVIFKKEDTISNQKKTKEEPSLNSKREQSIEGLLSLLKAEKERLRELENEYGKLGKNVTGEISDSRNYEEVDSNKTIESTPTTSPSDHLQSNNKPAGKNLSSSEESGNIPAKDASIKDGSSTVRLYTMKDNNKSTGGVNNAVNKRFEKVMKNANPLDIAECFYKLCEYDNAIQMYKLLTPADSSLDQYIWAQYQIANCYRNMKKFDIAYSEYQRFVNQYPNSDLIEQAKWYIDDINWWKSWYEKNTLTNNQLLTASNKP